MNKIQLKDFYITLKNKLEKNNNGLTGSRDILKELLPNFDLETDNISYEISFDDFVLITHIKDFLSVSTLEVEQIEEIKEEYTNYEYILPTNDISIFISENELRISQVVNVYLPNNDVDTIKVRIF